MATKIADLIAASKVPPGEVFFAGEDGYHAAFENHREAAKHLITKPGLEHLAYLTLLLSVECFLKYLICLVRHSSLGTAPALLKAVDNRAKDAPLNARQFGHSLKAMALMVESIFPALSNNPSFVSLRLKLPQDPTWVEDRYCAPSPSANYTAQLGDILGPFETLLATEFRDLL